MSCDILAPYNPFCCDIAISPDPLQQISSDYYDCSLGQITALIDKMYAAELFGNDVESEQFANAINDYHYLYSYLVMIYFQRLEDAANNPPCFTDKGLPFYISEYKIMCIRKYFECKGINIIPLLQAFDMVISGTPDGINFMSLEAAFPTTPDCPDDDQLFIVNKQI